MTGEGIGLTQVVTAVSAIAHASGGRIFKNRITDAVRQGMFNPVGQAIFKGKKSAGVSVMTAGLTVLGVGLVRKAANKAKLNPGVKIMDRWIRLV